MRVAYLSLLVCTMGGASHLSLLAEPSAAGFAGRWNLRIEGTGDTFSTAWLKIEKEGDDYTGALVWKWGSVVPIRDVTVESGELRFERGGTKYRAKLAGDELRGEAVQRDGKRFTFAGSRASEMVDVAGSWKVWPAGEPDGAAATLILEEEAGEIAGSAVDPDGIEYEVRNAKLEGFTLSFQAVPRGGDEITREVRCEVRGDKLVGNVVVAPSGETETRSIEFEGRREREWGEPVALLAENGLDGWSSRDPNRELGWKVTDGVLENSPPDVDIKSDAEFGDSRLRLEYKVEPGSNSGIYLRGRYELQILGDTRTADHGNMALYSRLAPKKNPIKLGEWNVLEVTFIGRWLTVVLNGETVYENQYVEGPTGGAYDPNEEQPGPLLLQGDHGKIRYRNIVVTPVR